MSYGCHLRRDKTAAGTGGAGGSLGRYSRRTFGTGRGRFGHRGQLVGMKDSGVGGLPGGPGLPDAGVVTLEGQPDEEHAFGPAAPLVAEWREIRAGMGDGSTGSRVDRAVAAVRRWELEAEMLRAFHLTLPPETDPLDGSRRKGM